MLNEYANLAFGKFVIPFMKMICLTAVTVTFFSLVRFRAELNGIYILFMPVTLICAAFTIIPISLVISSTFDISQEFLRPKISSSIQQAGAAGETKNPCVERQLRACQLIRCKVGNFYYMEAQAKLTMLDFTLNGLVFLLVNTEA